MGGGGDLQNDVYYHTSIATFLLLGKWFKLLKENNVYDRTRIILVADHGRGRTKYQGNFELPDGRMLQEYNPLLMMKDFGMNSNGEKITVDASFMTNADAVILSLQDIIENPVNPFTKKPITADKDDGVTITSIPALSNLAHSKSKWGYVIEKNQWLKVHTNIFDPDNWTAPIIEKN